MKVITHLRHDTPSHRLRSFFKQMPLITRLLLISYPLCSTVLILLRFPHSTHILSFLDSRPISQLILLLIVASTDLQTEEQKGSLYFLLSYITKSTNAHKQVPLLLILQLVWNICMNPSQFYAFACTSYPLLFCLSLAFRDMVTKSKSNRYFLVSAFQVKCCFYPFFLVLILQLSAWRFDIINAFFVGIISVLLDRGLAWIARILDRIFIGHKAQAIGLVKTGVPGVVSQMDGVKTNQSVVIDDS